MSGQSATPAATTPQDEPGPRPLPTPAVLPGAVRVHRLTRLDGSPGLAMFMQDGETVWALPGPVAERMSHLVAAHPDWPLNRVRLAAEWRGLPERTRRDHLLHIIGRFALRLHGPRRPW